jgi:zinc transport system substrate-binding protein
MRTLLFLLLLLFSFALPRELLMATTYPIYYPLLYLAGGLYEVKVLISTKTDIHHYEPKPQDLRNLKEAKHIFALGLESWERKLPVPKERLFLLNQNLPLIDDDPHIWMSPKSYQAVVAHLYKALLKMDPKNQNIYERKYIEFSKRLKDLDGKYRQSLSQCKNRWLVSTHLSLRYLARDYGLRAEGLRGVHGEEEPKPSELFRLITLMKKESIKSLFVEEGYQGKAVLKVQRETAAKIYTINTSLYPTKERDDYFSIMERNLSAFAEGLDCKR